MSRTSVDDSSAYDHRMAKGYWVVAYRWVSDPDALAKYGAQAGPVVLAEGGRFVVRGGKATGREHGAAERTVVVEFPSYDAAVAAYESDAYQAAVRILDGVAERDFRIVEGPE
ncbi:hypothetical protein PSU4_21420 [Pseudonocardia sulfidoxydans NBRC 16205]|uniref:DUF1330 domain-containing protein n=3 Tax=Pseudonocardia sulfidoxydans TaxID=54011 RepID=A0A511DJH6_9PSEU|nr:hypothetical protein PSU4_21420 [Pseudonocardia sulfidoxydans NBRC 16205]